MAVLSTEKTYTLILSEDEIRMILSSVENALESNLFSMHYEKIAKDFAEDIAPELI
jgi:hypothetical protein